MLCEYWVAPATLDTLDVETETPANVVGVIDGDTATLEYGTIVLTPSSSTTFSRAQTNIDFDDLVDASSSYEEDDMSLTTTGSFNRDVTNSPAASAAAATDVIELKSSATDPTAFALYSIDFMGDYDGTVDFNVVTTNGTKRTVKLSLSAVSGAFSTLSFAGELTELVTSVTWSLPAGLVMDNIAVATNLLTSADDDDVDLPDSVAVPTNATAAVDILFKTSESGAPELSGGDVSGGEFKGTPFTAEYVDETGAVVATPVDGQSYLARFTFHGNFALPDSSKVTIEGDNPLSIVVENDAFIGEINIVEPRLEISDSTLNFSGEDAFIDVDVRTAGLGGPGGGDGASTFGEGGGGTLGGSGDSGGDGGNGGRGGIIQCSNQQCTGDWQVLVSRDGDSGDSGRSEAVTVGNNGTDGSAGSDGFNFGAGGDAGLGGTGGDENDDVTNVLRSGSRGDGGNWVTSGSAGGWHGR